MQTFFTTSKLFPTIFFLFFNIFYCGFFAHLREMKRPKYFRNWFLIYARVVKAHVKGNTNRKITILCVKMFETTSEPMWQLCGRCIAIILWMVNPPKQVGCMIKYAVFWLNALCSSFTWYLDALGGRKAIILRIFAPHFKKTLDKKCRKIKKRVGRVFTYKARLAAKS